MSVHDQPDFARVYDEDDVLSIRKGDLRALLDIATSSLDFGSGFLNDEEVEILRSVAVTLGVDPMRVTPSNHECKYQPHEWQFVQPNLHHYIPKQPYWRCVRCRLEDFDRPAPEGDLS